MDINKLYQNKLSEVLSSGFVEESITRNIKESLETNIRNSVNSYDMNKLIQKKLESVIQTQLEGLDFSSMANKLVLEISNQVESIEKSVIGQATADLVKKHFEKEESFSFEDMINDYIQECREEYQSGSKGDSDFTLLIDDQYSYTKYIYIDPENEYSENNKYQCKYQIKIDRETRTIKSITEDRAEVGSRIHLGILDTFESKLFKRFLNKTPMLESDMDLTDCDFNIDMHDYD